MCKQRERIANSGHFAVDVCCRDRTVLTIGPVSVALERRALEQLASFLDVARRRPVIRDEHGSHWKEVARPRDLEHGD